MYGLFIGLKSFRPANQDLIELHSVLRNFDGSIMKPRLYGCQKYYNDKTGFKSRFHADCVTNRHFQWKSCQVLLFSIQCIIGLPIDAIKTDLSFWRYSFFFRWVYLILFLYFQLSWKSQGIFSLMLKSSFMIGWSEYHSKKCLSAVSVDKYKEWCPTNQIPDFEGTKFVCRYCTVTVYCPAPLVVVGSKKM